MSERNDPEASSFTPYLAAHAWAGESSRLSALEAWADPMTIDNLGRLGVGPGWRCCEVGAGMGSMARWLAGAVAPTGEVVAIDLDTSELSVGPHANLMIRQQDFLKEPLETASFDLIHERMVVGHLAERTEGLRRLAQALRPGALLLAEEVDWAGIQLGGWPGHPPELAALSARIFRAFLPLWAERGFDPFFGRTLPRALADIGLSVLSVEQRARSGQNVETPVLMLSVERFREPLLASHEVSESDLDAFAGLAQQPGAFIGGPLLVSVTARSTN